MVEYVDGSVIAQLGSPDMRTPIAYGLAWPSRIEASVTPLDFVKLGQLRFESPDLLRFPCLRLAAEAFDAGGSACATLNAANEIAVDAFLNGNLRFSQIPSLIEQVLQEIEVVAIGSIDEVFQADRIARLETQNRLAGFL
jgi:1-deoxy-D-xylulose-5-phosphate reductoisomerase